MPALTAKQVSLHLKAVPCWSKRSQTILRIFKFDGFLKVIDFVNRIARKAQKLNHHPDIAYSGGCRTLIPISVGQRSDFCRTLFRFRSDSVPG
jgi:hypothetical protein